MPQDDGNTDVIVAGGGLAGLACAVALSDAGLRVTVLEKSERLGGRASSWTDEASGDEVDIGPHIFHSEYRNMLAFLRRLRTDHLLCWQPHKVLTLASKPRPTRLRHAPLPPPFSLIPSMLGAPGLGMRDYLSMTRTGLAGMRFGEEHVDALDRISALDFLRHKRVSERMIDWWWRFAAIVVTNVPLERCSAASLLRIHSQLSGYRGLHFGFARVGLGSLYTEQSRAIIERAGGRVMTAAGVHRIDGRGAVLDGGARLSARHLVSAVPFSDLAGMTDTPGEWRSFEPSPYISCYLWFDRKLGNEKFFSHLWSPTRLNYDFYDLSLIREGWGERPSVIASNIIYSHRAHAMSDQEIVDATVSEIAEFAPQVLDASVLHARLHRIPMVIPCPLVGFERARPTAMCQDGLILAGDWTRTGLPCTMEGAVKSGWIAAEAVLAREGRYVQLAREPRETDGIAGLFRRLARGRANLP